MNKLVIDEKERIFIDGVQMQNVRFYNLKHSAGVGSPSELTITMDVSISQVGAESLK